MRRLRRYLPNRSDALGIVVMAPDPVRALQPVRLMQLIGGKRWSLSIVTYRDDPVLVTCAPFERSVA